MPALLQWELGKLGEHGWFLKNMYSSNNHYPTIEGGLGNGQLIIANEYPVAWEVENVKNEGEDVYV